MTATVEASGYALQKIEHLSADKTLLEMRVGELVMTLNEAAEFIQPFNRAEGLLDRIDAAVSKANEALRKVRASTEAA